MPRRQDSREDPGGDLRDKESCEGGPTRSQEEPESVRQVAPQSGNGGVADLDGQQVKQVPAGTYKYGGIPETGQDVVPVQGEHELYKTTQHRRAWLMTWRRADLGKQ